MANRYAIVLFSIVAGALVGCQAQSGMVVETLPPQNFNGPNPVQQAYVPPQPVAPVRPLVPLVTEPKIALKPTNKAPVPVEWVPSARPRPWKYIVIHHTATAAGGAAAIDRWHKDRGWDGIGYDFVVGNGTDTRDGQVEVGFRWKGQLTGAHTKTWDNKFNETGIGICLVGNFDVKHPSAQQLASVSKLVAYLMKTYNIPPERILGHGDTKSTDCPGKYMNLAEVKRRSLQAMADAGELPEGFGAQVANFRDGQELLQPMRSASISH